MPPLPSVADSVCWVISKREWDQEYSKTESPRLVNLKPVRLCTDPVDHSKSMLLLRCALLANKNVFLISFFQVMFAW